MDIINSKLPLDEKQIRTNVFIYISNLVREMESYILRLSIRDVWLARGVRDQASPTAETTTTTLTIADLLAYVITATHAVGGTQAYTLPTGTDMELGLSFDVDQALDWSIINLSTGANTVTLTANTAHTIVGNAIVAVSSSSLWRTRKTSSGTFVTYRIA